MTIRFTPEEAAEVLKDYVEKRGFFNGVTYDLLGAGLWIEDGEIQIEVWERKDVE
jgi:hypothetical protein